MADGISELAKIATRTMSQLDMVSNNLANVATPGFKVEHIYEGAGTKAQTDTGVAGDSAFSYVDFSSGIMQRTDNPLDVAIQNDGFFVIDTKAGPAYTRKGNFTIGKNNQLVTQSGDVVLGENGPITINGRNVQIDGSATITVDGAAIGKLQVVSFDKRQNLVPRGEGLFTDPGSAGKKKAATADVMPRHLEAANVNAIKEMVTMIGLQRSFESYQKVMLTIQDMDKLSTSRVGRVA